MVVVVVVVVVMGEGDDGTNADADCGSDGGIATCIEQRAILFIHLHSWHDEEHKIHSCQRNAANTNVKQKKSTLYTICSKHFHSCCANVRLL